MKILPHWIIIVVLMLLILSAAKITALQIATPQNTANNLVFQATSSFPTPTQNGLTAQVQSLPADTSISSHTLSSGGREDVEQVGNITLNQPSAYTGDDIQFNVTIHNTASYKKFIRYICFNSTEGSFGCERDFNLNGGQYFTISNSGRFTNSGIHRVWVSWSQDGTNFLPLSNSNPVSFTIL